MVQEYIVETWYFIFTKMFVYHLYYISQNPSVRVFHFFSETVNPLALKIGMGVFYGTGKPTKHFWVDSTFFRHFGP